MVVLFAYNDSNAACDLGFSATKVLFGSATMNATLPTSSSGLVTGDFYRDGSGYVRVV